MNRLISFILGLKNIATKRTLILIVACASPPRGLHAAPGFWPIDARTNLPLDSVVHLLLFDDDAATFIARDDVAGRREAYLANVIAHERAIREVEFDRPSANGVVSLAKLVRHGTGVVTNDARTIVTANHMFTKMSVKRHRMIIFDVRGRVLMDTRFRPKDIQSVDLAKAARRTGHPLAKLPAAELAQALDARILRLPEDLPVTPVRALAYAGVSGSPVILLGYPSPTFTRGLLFDKPDSLGRRLRGSLGRTVPVDTIYAGFLKRRLPDAHRLSLFVAAKIFADVDLVPGSSGGPLFDESGRMLGIMTARLDEGLMSTHDYAPRGGHGVSAAVIAELGNFSQCEVDLTRSDAS